MNKSAIVAGQRFGNLVAEEIAYRNKSRRLVWRFRCDCGNETYATSDDISVRKKRSCGCKKQAPCKGPCRKQNEYRIENDVVYVRVGSNGEEMLCDKDDWSKMFGRVWRLDPGGYARAGRFGSFTRKAIKCPNGMQVDHINRNRLDNRKSNLRIVSQFENSLNKKLRIENISGMTGVTWDNLENRWRVQVTKDGHSNWIGRFRDLSEAKEARIRGEIQYFGHVISEC